MKCHTNPAVFVVQGSNIDIGTNMYELRHPAANSITAVKSKMCQIIYSFQLNSIVLSVHITRHTTDKYNLLTRLIKVMIKV